MSLAPLVGRFPSNCPLPGVLREVSSSRLSRRQTGDKCVRNSAVSVQRSAFSAFLRQQGVHGTIARRAGSWESHQRKMGTNFSRRAFSSSVSQRRDLPDHSVPKCFIRVAVATVAGVQMGYKGCSCLRLTQT